MQGQLEGRTGRIEETRNWLGAAPLTSDGREIPVEYELDIETVISTVQHIRQLLQRMVQVHIYDPNPKNIARIKEMLTTEELRRTQFNA